jgi:hypothetical protein
MIASEMFRVATERLFESPLKVIEAFWTLKLSNKTLTSSPGLERLLREQPDFWIKS